jgi:hypothetical protein
MGYHVDGEASMPPEQSTQRFASLDADATERLAFYQLERCLDVLDWAWGCDRSWIEQAQCAVTFSFDGTDWDALAVETGGRSATLAEGATAQVVLLAAPWSAVGKVLSTAGSLAGKVVLDATNPHQPMRGASGAEEVALRAPGARVVKGVQHGVRAGSRPGRRRARAAESGVLR